MYSLSAYVQGIGLIGPGVNNWTQARAILRGETTYLPQKTIYPLVNSLPPTERRRTGQVVKLALSVGFEALAHAGQTPEDLLAVFASSGGDSQNCHAICETVTSDDKNISPTRFHNSVTNAPAGYWGIATGSMAPSTVICAFDASFCAGLLEALVQVMTSHTPCILIAYDIDYPEPLHSARPIPDGFGVALALTPHRTERSLFELKAALTQEAADSCGDVVLEQLRLTVPAARALPMLEIFARGAPGRVVLGYLDTARVWVELTPCP